MNNEQDIWAIMDDMSSRQGYKSSNTISKPSVMLHQNQNNAKTTTKSHTTITKPVKTNIQKSASIQFNNCVRPETGWDGAIWNPLVSAQQKHQHQSSSSSKSISIVSPEVEIQRRRCYEKFKKQVYTIFQQTMPMISTENKEQLLQIWKSLPYPTILEHWHFSCKLEEAQQTNPTSRCYNANYDKQKNDPILLSPWVINEDKALYFLKSEIAFQWKRQSKQQQNLQNSKQTSTHSDSLTLPDFLSRYIEKQLMPRIRNVVIDTYKEFYKHLQRTQLISNNNKSKSIKIKINLDASKAKSDTQQVSLTCNGLTLYINHAHYQKLKAMFQRNYPHIHNAMESSSSSTTSSLLFTQALFSLLCRYDSLAGAGLQSSLTGDVFDVLLKHFSCHMECFASPLNSRYGNFCSAFPDVDGPFGSMGSFFEYPFSSMISNGGGGCFQANPPFVADLIHEMVHTMEYHLKQTEPQKQPLLFIIFIPKWEHTVGYERVKQSKYCQHVMHLSQKKDAHYYCEGTQHRRKTRYRIASFDTSILFLMNEAAKQKWNISSDIFQDIKRAFQKIPEEQGGDDGKNEPNKIYDNNDNNNENHRDSKKKKQEKKRKRMDSTSMTPTETTIEHKVTNKDQTSDMESTSKKQNKKKKNEKKKTKSNMTSTEEQSNQLNILSTLGILSSDKKILDPKGMQQNKSKTKAKTKQKRSGKK